MASFSMLTATLCGDFWDDSFLEGSPTGGAKTRLKVSLETPSAEERCFKVNVLPFGPDGNSLNDESKSPLMSLAPQGT